MALAAGLAGVYLPLLWGDPDKAGCSRIPTSLLFHRAHFSVLATVECCEPAAGARVGAGAGAGTAFPRGTALPLAVHAFGALQRLPVRFLLPEEEEREEQLLSSWMDTLPTPLPEGVGAFIVRPAPARNCSCSIELALSHLALSPIACARFW